MKKILVLLMIICLCACHKEPTMEEKLAEVGYSEQDIAFIMSLDQNKQEKFLEGLDERSLRFMKLEGCIDDNLDAYLKYDGQFDDDKVVELVNRGILNDGSLSSLKELYNSDYYLEKNEDLYLQYLDQYDSVRSMIEIVNTRRYKEMFSDIVLNDVSKNYLMLVNKYYSLPSDYEPDDLVDVPSEYGRGRVRQVPFEAFVKLHDDALEAGYDIRIVSAYRSYDYQQGLYEKYLQVDPQEVVDTYSARPGLSEHQTGLCMDVSLPGLSIDDFYLTDASVWLAENCHRYGFIIRFPRYKDNITGYQWESWHIRYLGVEAATDVYERGITFDEYYACFVED